MDELNLPINATLLADYLEQEDGGIQHQGNLIAYPQQWQVPAATEKAAYESLLMKADNLVFTYVGFPWATLIDYLLKDIHHKWELVRKLDIVRRHLGAHDSAQRVTVVQHIRADRYMVLFKACGITDLFWSHATIGREEIEGIRIHPFPLFPAQTPNELEAFDLKCPRRYLANFIGAYTPGLYLTDVREHIFRDTDKMDDILIIQRDAWHFERTVYTEQMKKRKASDAQTALERQHKEQYLQAIRDSTFTLCPTGSGPNSIRIVEALALGSIPVILTKDLALPGDRELWEKACLFEEDDRDGYRRALARMRSMLKSEIKMRQKFTRDLHATISPKAYASLLINALNPKV